LMRAYALLDVDPPSNKEEVRKKYKKLVKVHHPDANGGNKESEEKFKDISEAYQLIMLAFDNSLL
ncbi:MAG: DnaJ domain-containing protein, partial [Rhodospirillaceae bacterium]|nr:DnaJ domain-containing protein [Rhodospirillaceae bacterium]